MKKSFLILSLFIFSIFATISVEKSYGRKPAVLPVSGIAIDDMAPGKNNKINGYNFDKSVKAVRINEKLATRDTSSLPIKGIEPGTKSELIPALILFLVLLPVAFWVSLKKVEKSRAEGEKIANDLQDTGSIAEVVELHPKNDKKEEKVKKAG